MAKRSSSLAADQPLVRLQPCLRKRGSAACSMKGKLKVGPEFFEPLPDAELAAWE